MRPSAFKIEASLGSRATLGFLEAVSMDCNELTPAVPNFFTSGLPCVTGVFLTDASGVPCNPFARITRSTASRSKIDVFLSVGCAGGSDGSKVVGEMTPSAAIGEVLDRISQSLTHLCREPMSHYQYNNHAVGIYQASALHQEFSPIHAAQ